MVACADGLPYTVAMRDTLWDEILIRRESYQLLNLEHERVEKEIIAEMERGIDVYFDRRWEATAHLTDWLVEHRNLLTGLRILILGAGVGAETLVLGRHAKHIWLNDLSPTALELCSEQMTQNGLTNFTLLPGRFEELELPSVDLVVASFLIYNKETFKAMTAFQKTHHGETILVNERLAPFPKFLRKHRHSLLFEVDGAVGVRIEKSAAPGDLPAASLTSASSAS